MATSKKKKVAGAVAAAATTVGSAAVGRKKGRAKGARVAENRRTKQVKKYAKKRAAYESSRDRGRTGIFINKEGKYHSPLHAHISRQEIKREHKNLIQSYRHKNQARRLDPHIGKRGKAIVSKHGRQGAAKGAAVGVGVVVGAAAVGYGAHKLHQRHVNNRNAKTGVRTSRPAAVRSGSRVKKKR